MKILIIALTAILAVSSLVGSGEYPSYNKINVQENPLYIHADGFLIGIDTAKPGVEFYSGNNTNPVFAVSYLSLYAYEKDLNSPVYQANFSTAVWNTTVYNTTEEDGTVRTVVTMSTMIDMRSDKNSVENWGRLTFNFLILSRGERAQLGISVKIGDMKAISGVSHLSLVQRIGGDAKLIVDENKIMISGIYYRWDPTASVKMGTENSEVEVRAHYSDNELYLTYPYSQNMVEISHYSGRMELTNSVVIRDYFSEMIGYGVGILLGSSALGLPYIVHKKKRKSPFDMNSPIYKK